MTIRSSRTVILLILSLFIAYGVSAQKKQKVSDGSGTPIMWEKVDISQQDLFLGPGGKDMQPDLSSITFIKDKPGGHSVKYNIKDGAGHKWVAKIGDEARPETAAVRLLAALGYKTEINYLVPELTIPGKGTFKNVRLEARPDDVKREGPWEWNNNPFKGRRISGSEDNDVVY